MPAELTGLATILALSARLRLAAPLPAAGMIWWRTPDSGSFPRVFRGIIA